MIKRDLFIAKQEPFWGNFGVFEDSLPDGYGRYLLNRMLKKQGIDDSTKLMYYWGKSCYADDRFLKK